MNDTASTTHPLTCRCGTVQGYIVAPERANRGLCYCNDCQAYARFLDAHAILDDAGGTQIVATQPRYVHFTQGFDAIACMSLSENGLLRWYASCCNTPLGNTPRAMAVAYVGFVHSCVVADTAQLAAVFGPLRVILNTQSATQPVPTTPLNNALAIVRLGVRLILARLSGAYKHNPLFSAEGQPLKPVRVLSAAERERLKSDVTEM